MEFIPKKCVAAAFPKTLVSSESRPKEQLATYFLKPLGGR